MKAQYNNLKNGMSAKINIKKNLMQIRSPLFKKLDQGSQNTSSIYRAELRKQVEDVENRRIINKPSELNLKKLIKCSEISSPITVRSPKYSRLKSENSACPEAWNRKGKILHAVIKCKNLSCSAELESKDKDVNKDNKSTVKSPIKIEEVISVDIEQQEPMNRRRRVTEGAPSRNHSQIKQPQKGIKRRVTISQKCLQKSDVHRKINYQKYQSILPPLIHNKNRLKLPQQQKSFQLDKLIGSGSNSQVYLAHTTSDLSSFEHNSSKYIIKIYDKNKFWSKSKKQRIYSQIRILSTMEPHNNIITLIQAYQNKTQIHLIFQYIQNGETLTKYFQSRNFKVQQKQVSKIFYKIVRGLAHLHGQGIIHRDLKPDNIIIGIDQDGGMAIKIIDFGLAIDQFSINTSLHCGTKNYLALKQPATPSLLPLYLDQFHLQLYPVVTHLHYQKSNPQIYGHWGQCCTI